MTGGESLWRAQWSERADPFAHLGPAQIQRASTRGPGWQRASRDGRFNAEPQRIIEARASAVSLGNQGRTDLSLGQRVFHGKFGYGTIAAMEGNKLEIDFEKPAAKRSSTASSAPTDGAALEFARPKQCRMQLQGGGKRSDRARLARRAPTFEGTRHSSCNYFRALA